MPYVSTRWRFLYLGYMGGTATGRAAAITNIAGGTTIQLVDTLNNSGYNNSSPILTIVPTPFFCLNASCNYNPGAVDADGDSLRFNLVPGANGPGSTACTPGGLVTYTGGYSATNPLSTSAGSFSFNASTGQISFIPNIIQRSLVVYNIREFRNDTLVGTCQREMTFKVLTCTGTAPTGGLTSATNGTIQDSTNFYICMNTGAFSIDIVPTAEDTTNTITVSHTGVPAGATFTVTNNGTNHPVATFTWTSTGVTPGFYTFFVNYVDNNCPISNQQTLAYTVAILPIPTLVASIVSAASCAGDAVVSITPGGLGSPWTVETRDATGTVIDTHIGVTGTYLDTFLLGNDSLIIYSSLSTLCNGRYPLVITMPPFVTPTATHVDPSFCGNNDGSITLEGLNPGELDTIKYTFNGVPQPPVVMLVSGTGTVTLSNLCAGVYTNITVTYYRCVSTPIGPVTLNNPGFFIDRLSITNPTKCGFNDGVIKIHGIRPGQTDTVKYTLDGVPQTPVVSYVGTDSTIVLSTLFAGTYANIQVNTQGNCPNSVGCLSNVLGPAVLVAPPISAGYTSVTSLGCNGDTVAFTNLSSPASELYYRWYFGDGGTDTSRNPTHIYHSATGGSFTVRMLITNTRCTDSFVQTITLPENVKAQFTVAPDTICQNTPLTLTNLSTGVTPTYMWDFGDGFTSVAVNPTHSFANTGSYTISLIATDFKPCSDTFRLNVQIDSNTLMSLHASDSTICSGGQITLTGTYTDIGLTGVTWNLGDGNFVVNSNPVQHSYEATTPTTLTVSATVTYRTCPTATITKNIRIYPNPSLYLGPDFEFCPGSKQVTVIDQGNRSNPLAVWIWNTGETTPDIVVNKPGVYIGTVNIYGCIATDTVIVYKDCYVDIPNIFSPNGDGVNDFFFPRGLLSRGLTEFSMNIYNRWGQLIYTTNSTEGRGWDGKFNDVPQPQGVYVYEMKGKFKDGIILDKKGNVTLIK